MTNVALDSSDARFLAGEKRDGIEAETPAIREILRTLTPEMKQWQELSGWISLRIIVTTVLWISVVIAVRRWADQVAVSFIVFVALAALQHRCNIIQHEAIHRLLFRNRLLNDLIGHHFFGASLLTPHTYRFYHFKHHRELGRESDPDFPGYNRFPTSRWGVFRFVLENLIGLGVVTRFLAETRSAVSRSEDPRAYHENRGWKAALLAWGSVAIVQWVLLGLFVLTGGSLGEFLLFWVLPEITLTRTLMAIRLMGEHASRGEEFPRDIRYLVTLPSNIFERILFAPLNFNYHAEHHLFPAVPWHRLEKLHNRLMELPEYRQVVGVRRGYLHAVFHSCIRTKTSL